MEEVRELLSVVFHVSSPVVVAPPTCILQEQVPVTLAIVVPITPKAPARRPLLMTPSLMRMMLEGLRDFLV